jgi:hypothetical protein
MDASASSGDGDDDEDEVAGGDATDTPKIDELD